MSYDTVSEFTPIMYAMYLGTPAFYQVFQKSCKSPSSEAWKKKIFIKEPPSRQQMV